MTQRFSILGPDLAFDTGVYVSPYTSQLALANPKPQLPVVLPFPNGADLGLSGSFTVPSNYAADPVLRATFVIDGTPANVLGLAALHVQVADQGGIDVAYEAEDTATVNAWTGYADKDLLVLTLALTPSAALVPGNTVYWRFVRDDSADTQSIDMLLRDLEFQYTEG
jgi:hypothetical protein